MKKCWALILALCMLLSPAAVADTSVTTEALLQQIVRILADGLPFWLTYADDAVQLSGGMVVDEDGMPAVGVRRQEGGKDAYAALDAQGVRYSDGVQTMAATWEEMLGAGGAYSAAPQVTQEDWQMLGELLGEAFVPVGDLVQIVISDAELNGSPAQRTEIVLPLRQICQTLDKSMLDAINSRYGQLRELMLRNQRFLRSLGLSSPDMAELWQQLRLSELIPVEVNAVVRYTEAGGAWKLEASVLAAGLELNGDGTHIDGRIYAGAQEWTFDTRDLETLAGWLREIMSRVSPEAFDFTFHEDSAAVRLHVKMDVEQLSAQLLGGMDLVLKKYGDQAQALIDRYAPLAQLLGAELPEDCSVEAISQQLQTDIQRTVARWKLKNKNRSMYSTGSMRLELDFYLAEGEALSLFYSDGSRRVELSADGAGMELSAGMLVGRSEYTCDARGAWGTDAMHLSGTLAVNGTVSTRWELAGTMENGVRVFSLSANDAWVGACTLRESSAELTTSAGVKGTLIWSDQGVSLHGSYGEDTLDASVRVTDRHIIASLNAGGYEGTLSLREEGDMLRGRLEWIATGRGRYADRFVLEAAGGDGQMMFKAGRYLRAMLEDQARWEVILDARPSQVSGSLYTGDTQASFLWTPGVLSAQSYYRMSGLITDTQVLVRDITEAGVDFNVTQIEWNQKLHYRDEIIDNSLVYTVRATLEENTLRLDITDQDGKQAVATIAALMEPAKLDDLLGLTAAAVKSAPAATEAPASSTGSFLAPAAQPTTAPSGGVFLTGPKK